METNPISQIGNVTRQINEQSFKDRIGKAGDQTQQATQHAQAAGGPPRQDDPAAADRANQRRVEPAPKNDNAAGKRVDRYA